MRSSTGDPWLDWLQELLCKVYERRDSSCDTDSPASPTDWVARVVDMYIQRGAPVLADPLEKQDYLSGLQALEFHLDLSDNSLSTSDSDKLRALITDLRKDLGS